MNVTTVKATPGALAAQRAIDDITAGQDAGIAWLRYLELTVKHGRSSNECRLFINELATRAASAGQGIA